MFYFCDALILPGYGFYVLQADALLNGAAYGSGISGFNNQEIASCFGCEPQKSLGFLHLHTRCDGIVQNIGKDNA